MTDVLRVETARGVAWVTIDHPPDHLVDAAFIGALASTLPALEADPGTHRARMARFLAAGGQTRTLERGSIEPLVAAMHEDDDGG